MIGIWKKILILSFVPLCAVFVSGQNDIPISHYQGKDVASILEMMPRKDKERLEYFFQTLIGWDAFGYVLFGDKPMSFSSSEKQINPFNSFDSFCFAISPRRIQTVNGFETWKKYESLFSMPRFVFLYDESPSNETFLFINKKKFISTVDRHALLFQHVLRREVTGEELLQEATSKPLLSEVLADQDELIGILFGFGEKNACLFQRMMQLKSAKEQADFCKKFSFGYPWEKEDEELDKGYESVGWISANITGAHLKNLDLINLPGFCAILNDPETAALKEHYLETREKIIEYYKDKDFLEATLQALTAE